jgi:hypothetical protein
VFLNILMNLLDTVRAVQVLEIKTSIEAATGTLVGLKIKSMRQDVIALAYTCLGAKCEVRNADNLWGRDCFPVTKENTQTCD